MPLLQQCVFKKTKKGDNADVVQAALSCARAFLEKVSDEENAENRCLLLFEAAEKKKNKLSGGKLFADLLAHEDGEIVVDAAACLRTLLKAAVVGEEHPYLTIAASGDPVGALVHMISQGTPSDIWPEEDCGLPAALEALSKECADNQVALSRAGAVAPLVGLLGSPSAEAQARAASEARALEELLALQGAASPIE